MSDLSSLAPTAAANFFIRDYRTPDAFSHGKGEEGSAILTKAEHLMSQSKCESVVLDRDGKTETLR